MPTAQEQSSPTNLLAPQTANPALSNCEKAHDTPRNAYAQEITKRTLLGALWNRRCRRWLLYVLRQEFRTFRSRIQYALESHVYDYLDVGLAFEELQNGNLVVCQRTLHRNRDMQQFRESWQKWAASSPDCEVFLLGWTAGEQSAKQDAQTDIGSQPQG